jgi:hypothetical protein
MAKALPTLRALAQRSQEAMAVQAALAGVVPILDHISLRNPTKWGESCRSGQGLKAE